MINKAKPGPYTTVYRNKNGFHNPHIHAISIIEIKFRFLNGKAQNIVGPYRTNTRVYYINNIRIDTRGYSNDKFTK